MYLYIFTQGVLRDGRDLEMFSEDFKKLYSKTRLNMFDEEYENEDEDQDKY